MEDAPDVKKAGSVPACKNLGRLRNIQGNPCGFKVLRRTKVARLLLGSDFSDSEKPAMLAHGVSVGHSGNVVGDRARLVFGIEVLRRQ